MPSGNSSTPQSWEATFNVSSWLHRLLVHLGDLVCDVPVHQLSRHSLEEGHLFLRFFAELAQRVVDDEVDELAVSHSCVVEVVGEPLE